MAAMEAKERLELLFGAALAQSQFGQPCSTLPPVEQHQLARVSTARLPRSCGLARSTLYSRACCVMTSTSSRISEELTWTKQLSIYFALNHSAAFTICCI